MVDAGTATRNSIVAVVWAREEEEERKEGEKKRKFFNYHKLSNRQKFFYKFHNKNLSKYLKKHFDNELLNLDTELSRPIRILWLSIQNPM